MFQDTPMRSLIVIYDLYDVTALKQVVILGILAGIMLVAAAFAVMSVEKASSNVALHGIIRTTGYSHNLDGLKARQWWPIVDSNTKGTGNIVQADITLTDATATCAAGTGTAPTNVKVLVGKIGGTLVNVATAATNTGVSSWSGLQCIFKVTVIPGQNGVPDTVTDIIAANAGASTLDGSANITVLFQLNPLSALSP